MTQAQLKTGEEAENQWVFSFGKTLCEGDSSQKNLLGGKGANLAEMSRLGLPVPPGFILSTAVCARFYDTGQSYPAGLEAQVRDGMTRLETETGLAFGGAEKPLLLSVRSGARVSMPGMMDTILNIGLNDRTVVSLGDDRFAWDCYRRLIQMYADVVLGVDHDRFEDVLDTYKRRNDIALDTDVTAEGWRDIVSGYKQVVQDETGAPFPQDPWQQLWGAVGAVFKSWMTPRAVTYRKINNIPESWGTAVCVQAVVFGNMGDDCGTGVAFTRDPSTGENIFYGEYLVNAQGEDVVAGIRTPQPLASLEQAMPDVYRQLCDVRALLERHYRDMQDIEFTVQNGRLYMLQTRAGKRTARAALKIAADMVREGLIDKKEAVARISPASLDQLLHPAIDPSAERRVLASGLPASPGAAAGEIVFDADTAERLKNDGRKVILCRAETSPEDIHGMHAAEGILTSRGGMTSHAAVVARGMGKPCVSGASDIVIDMTAGTMTAGAQVFRAGDLLTIDGTTGDVMAGLIPMTQPEMTEDFRTIMGWADDIRRLRVRANAETPVDARAALAFGAEGIGLCRTEHMFFDPERINHVRRMILADTRAERAAALAALLPFQRADFTDLFAIMRGLPVTIRLLDPPLHEFLPQEDNDIAAVAKETGVAPDTLRKRIQRLHETNPMLGLRGARLGVLYPEIYEMQVQAIFEAARATGAAPEIMLPLIATRQEMEQLKSLVSAMAEETGFRNYTLGTMIELPRAALAAGEIAATVQFFSFGTNDLTQTALGISRDDAGSFLPVYQQRGIWAVDPFVSIDTEGVGELVRIAVARGRKARADLKLGVCGEHGGDPASIKFFDGAGLDYVSCSPYRVPVARLAAAQAVISQEPGYQTQAD